MSRDLRVYLFLALASHEQRICAPCVHLGFPGQSRERVQYSSRRDAQRRVARGVARAVLAMDVDMDDASDRQQMDVDHDDADCDERDDVREGMSESSPEESAHE